MPNKSPQKAKEEELFDDDNCEVCKLMKAKGENVTEEELVKAISLQNFLNSIPKTQDKKKK